MMSTEEEPRCWFELASEDELFIVLQNKKAKSVIKKHNGI